MNTIVHKAESRGHANHGWLNANHSFSFADYYNPERMHFGVLRVLNDDTISGGKGFGMHPHKNMEIISIPLEGALEHKDSMGNSAVIKKGDVQVMSAGTGINHSEFNHYADQNTKLLQIWLFPNKQNVTPRYQQITLNDDERKNKLQQILSPNINDEGVWIHQNAWFCLGQFDKDISYNYKVHAKENGIYAFVISGDFSIGEQTLNARDGIGIWNTKEIAFKALSKKSEILLMEIPMTM